MSALTNLAIAVTAALNAGTFTPSFTAVRAYRPMIDLTQHFDGLSVTVIGGDSSATPLARRTVDLEVPIGVCLQQFVAADTDCDPLMLLSEQIQQALEISFPPPLDAHWIGTKPGFPNPDHLTHQSLCTIVSVLTYRMRRPR
jgi:hypothetical protein